MADDRTTRIGRWCIEADHNHPTDAPPPALALCEAANATLDRRDSEPVRILQADIHHTTGKGHTLTVLAATIERDDIGERFSCALVTGAAKRIRLDTAPRFNKKALGRLHITLNRVELDQALLEVRAQDDADRAREKAKQEARA